VANPALALRALVDGFHRHDLVDRALEPEGPPRPHSQIKLELQLAVPLPCADYPDETATWLAMGGQVTEILGLDRVVAELVASTDRTPADFAGSWRAELARTPGLEFPWILASMAPLPAIERTIGVAHDGNHYFRIACEGEGARAAFDDVLRAMGTEPAEHATFLSLVLGTFIAWLFVVPNELADASASHELLIDSADAVIVFGATSRSFGDRLVIEAEPGMPAIDACKAAMKRVLERVRSTR